MTSGRFRMGLDIGQSNDRSAFAAVECVGQRFEVRQIARFPLGMAYVAPPGEPSVASLVVKAAAQIVAMDYAEKERIAEKTNTRPEPAEGVTVIIDGTGVGAGLVETIRLGLGQDVYLRVVEIAPGTDKVETVKRANGMPYVRVGKEFLVGRLNGLLQTRMVSGAPTPEFVETQEEARLFQRRTNTRQHDVYGAKSGAHDDLVLCLSLSVMDEIPTDPGALVELNNALGVVDLMPDRLGKLDEFSFGPSTMGVEW